MSENRSEDTRSRDDRHLRKLVSETRAWMRAEGIEERPLEWEAIARDEQARWWRERLRRALADLAARGQEFAEPLATRLRKLAATAESGAEAALEVTLDAVQQVGRVLVEPARACLRAGAALQFSYAPAGVRTKLGLAEAQEESVGIFITSTIPGARVIADARQRRVTIEFWEPLSAPWVVLVSEDSSAVPRMAELSSVDNTAQVRFDDVPPGRYLLCCYAREEAAA